jgi:hypothetical protein
MMYDVTVLQTITLLFETSEKDKAIEIAEIVSARADELVSYYRETDQYGQQLQIQMIILREIARIYSAYDEHERGKAVQGIFNKHAGPLNNQRIDM